MQLKKIKRQFKKCTIKNGRTKTKLVREKTPMVSNLMLRHKD